MLNSFPVLGPLRLNALLSLLEVELRPLEAHMILFFQSGFLRQLVLQDGYLTFDLAQLARQMQNLFLQLRFYLCTFLA